MAWTTPPTWNSGDTLAASDLQIVSDDLTYLKGVTDGVTASGCTVSRATNQSINDSTTTSITFLIEDMDLGGWWSSGTDIVVPAGAIPAGFTTILVHIIGDIQFAANGTGYRAVSIYINGSLLGTRNSSAVSGETTSVGIDRYAVVAAADVITIRATQTSGGALNATKITASVVRHAPAA